MGLAVDVDHLAKSFRVPVRGETGLRASTVALFRRQHRVVEAVDDVSFTIDPGEVVGFLGPNGAGKTTTLKMLSGLLLPDRRRAAVLGFDPFRRGRRVPAADHAGDGQPQPVAVGPSGDRQLRAATGRSTGSRVPSFVAIRDELIELLELGDLVDKPVRKLSLGERMKSRSPARCCTSPRCCSSTSRPSVSTSRCSAGSAASSPTTTRARSVRDADQPLHGRRRGAVQAGDRDPPRAAAVRRDLSSLADRFGATKTITVQLRRRRGRRRVRDRRCRGASRGCRDRNGSTATRALTVLRRPCRRARAAALLLERLDVVDVSIEDPPIET